MRTSVFRLQTRVFLSRSVVAGPRLSMISQHLRYETGDWDGCNDQLDFAYQIERGLLGGVFHRASELGASS